VVVKPNFVVSDTWEADRKTEDFALFAGRLSPEKGIGTLLAAWDTGKIAFRLKIAGLGPMVDQVRSCAASNAQVEYLGLQPSANVYSEMAKARFLVFPSEWYEGLSRTVIEAFSQGTPVLAADLGAVGELVEEGVTGYRFPPGNIDALVAGTRRFPTGSSYQRMRLSCRNLYLSRFTAAINYPQLTEIYAKAISIRKMRKRPS
jgi:glycosyltransferase involved in cell wall biosynthesis